MIKFIAEVSSNHQCDLERSFALIDAAANAGCAAVKFQLFKIDQLFAPEILKKSAEHRKRRAWELPVDFLPKLAKRCEDMGIEFACTPFYLDAVKELQSYVDFYKIASYELLWDDLLAACARTGKRVMLSTGMATMPEIQHAVEVLKANGCASPLLFHCTSAYPTPYKEANLAAIETLRQITGCAIGWSDHTVEPGVLYRAIHRWGAEAIEFHIDLEGDGAEFSSGHCWLPQQIAAVIADVKRGMLADGSGIKEPTQSELSDRDWRTDPLDGLRPMKSVRKTWQQKTTG